MSVHEHLVPVAATGALRRFAEAGVLSPAAVHVARTISRISLESRPEVQLAAALAVRALERGSVSLDLRTVRAEVEAWLTDQDADQPTPATERPALPWPPDDEWRSMIASSPAVGDRLTPLNRRPLRLVDDLLYLERYWCDEAEVRAGLDARAARRSSIRPDAETLSVATATTLTGQTPDELQVEAALTPLRAPTTVLAGGPGTGKTATVARMLVTLQQQSDRPLTVALAAPSGKAAARLQESVAAQLAALPGRQPIVEPAQTVHRLLGSRGPLRGFDRGPDNPLPFDVVVVDEMSMLALPLMASLVRAVPPTTRLVLVGDPMQLTSVEAGSVLADLTVAARAGSSRVDLVELTHNWRSHGAVARLAEAIRAGDVDAALDVVVTGAPAVTFIETDRPTRLAEVAELSDETARNLAATTAAARAGDAESALALIEARRLLCAHRHGPYGVSWWARQVDDLSRELGLRPPGSEWYPGRGVLISRNAAELGLRNGDTGVVIASSQGLRVAFAQPGRAPRLLPPWVLDDVDTLHAMTVHKAQGSQFDHVGLILPPASSPLLTRELVYTGITRTVEQITIVATRDSLARAIRTPAARVSGLALGW